MPTGHSSLLTIIAAEHLTPGPGMFKSFARLRESVPYRVRSIPARRPATRAGKARVHLLWDWKRISLLDPYNRLRMPTPGRKCSASIFWSALACLCFERPLDSCWNVAVLPLVLGGIILIAVVIPILVCATVVAQLGRRAATEFQPTAGPMTGCNSTFWKPSSASKGFNPQPAP